MLCVCCPAVVSGGKQRLVKTFTSWQVLASLENTGWCRRWSGTGGSSAERITAGQRWQFLTIYIENVIISVTMITKMLFVTRRAKMPLQGVFALCPYKIPMSRQKRRTAHLHKIW